MLCACERFRIKRMCNLFSAHSVCTIKVYWIECLSPICQYAFWKLFIQSQQRFDNKKNEQSFRIGIYMTERAQAHEASNK